MPVVLPAVLVSLPGTSLAGSYNGLAFGVAQPRPRLDVVTFVGFHDLPDVRSADIARANDHGDFRGLDWLSSRTMQLGLRVIAKDNDNAGYLAQIEAIKTAFTMSNSNEIPLYIWDSTRIVNCRVRRRNIPLDTAWYANYGEALMELTASDPRIYDAVPTVQAVPVAVAGAGFSFPITFPLTFGTAGAGGTFAVMNAGNFTTRPTIHIQGPVDNPRLEHTDQGKTITMAISLAAGDYLDIDFAARTIVLNGTASRRNSLVAGSAWWDLPPGLNHLRYAANTLQLGSVATINFRSAWI